MKSKEAILTRLEELENDPRHKYPPALVQINAPLALIQVELDTEISALKWVLDEKNDRPSW